MGSRLEDFGSLLLPKSGSCCASGLPSFSLEGDTQPSAEETTLTLPFYSSLRFPEGIMTELLAESRFRKLLQVCLLQMQWAQAWVGGCPLRKPGFQPWA